MATVSGKYVHGTVKSGKERLLKPSADVGERIFYRDKEAEFNIEDFAF